MPVDTRINVPFIPQEGITSQILTAIQLANEQHNQQQQRNIQQQQATQQGQLGEAQIEEAKARAGFYGTEAARNQQQLDMVKRAQSMFSSPQGAQPQAAGPDVAQQVQMYPGSDLAKEATANPEAFRQAPIQATNAKWMPQGTPPQLTPFVNAMLPSDLSDQEKTVIEAGAQAGRMKAMQTGDIAGYLNDIRSGVDSVVQARNAAAKPEGERALGNARVDQLNEGMRQRWAVLNPGKELPASFTLPATATQKDFDRLDKLLEATEKAHGTKAQQQTANAIRDQTLQLQKQNSSRKDMDFIDKNYVKPANDTEKSYQMFVDAYNNRNDAKTGAESMLALSTHLATTFGNVKGSRVTKDMIQEHLGARGVSDSAQVAVQKLTNGDVLSPDQWDAFKGLITNSRNLSWKTAQKEAKRRDVDISGSLPSDLKNSADIPEGAIPGKLNGKPGYVLNGEFHPY